MEDNQLSVYPKYFLKNVETYFKYKFLILKQVKNKKKGFLMEEVKISPEDEINKLKSIIGKFRDYYIFTIKENNYDESKIDFYVYILTSTTQKSKKNLITKTNFVKELLKKNDFSYPLITYILEHSEQINSISSLLSEHPDCFLNLDMFAVNLNSSILETYAIYEYDYHILIKSLKLLNKYKVNTDSLDSNIFIKLFYTGIPLYGLCFVYSNAITGKQIEYRFYLPPAPQTKQ
jgi:hypothetical protein